MHRQALFLSSPILNCKRDAVAFDTRPSASQPAHHVLLGRQHHGKRSTLSPTLRASSNDVHITQTIQKRQSFFARSNDTDIVTRRIRDYETTSLSRFIIAVQERQPTKRFLGADEGNHGENYPQLCISPVSMQQQILTQRLHRLMNRGAILPAKFFFIRTIFFLTILEAMTMKCSSRYRQKNLVLATK